ncbi:MAG: PD40 domain-containing protein [Acidobacteria bacterium]|nr:PD40 domain-containing protein [Acidobacteriota bacterium]
MTIFGCVCAAALARGDEKPLLLQRPALSATHITFVFADDLWIVPREGGEARRLTSAPGLETAPAFSPDGTQIAFAAAQAGNFDVFVMPASGGSWRRLTFHPELDVPVGWTPDGRRVVLASGRGREQAHLGAMKLYTAPIEGGFEEEIPLPIAGDGSYSPDGRRFAYTPRGHVFFNTWKRYRGGSTRGILLAELSDSSVAPIPRKNSNDVHPMWVGDSIYFLSDRDGPTTLFRYETTSKQVTKVVDNRGFDVKWASAGPGAIVYEQFGSLHLFDLKSGKPRRVPIRITEDLSQIKPGTVKAGDMLVHASLSPNGAEVVAEARGEILVLNAGTGESRVLTKTAGVAERDPAWSPNGEWIAYFSDESGEYELHLRSPDGSKLNKIRLADRPVFYQSPVWSPDSRRIAYVDNHLGLWYVDVEQKRPVLVDRDLYQWETSLAPSWSPDGKWLAYRRQQPSRLGGIHLYSLDTGKSTQVTDAMADASHPVFDRDGSRLYFLASTESGPSREIDVLNFERGVNNRIYAAVLSSQASSLSGSVDVEGLSRRIVSLPFPAGRYAELKTGAAGILFAKEVEDPRRPRVMTIRRLAVAGRSSTVVASGVREFVVEAKTETLLWRQSGFWTIARAGGKESVLKTDGVEVRSVPKEEWAQIYREAWRLIRDFFYDPNYHGLEPGAVSERYAIFLDGLGSRRDLNYLLAEALGELSVGHLSVGGGEQRSEVREAAAGLLGADYHVEEGRYRFARILRGENWNQEVVAPLAQPAVDVAAGDFLLSVDGRELLAEDNFFEFFKGKAGKPTKIRVAATPDGANARETTAVPIASEASLRHAEWVEVNRRKVDSSTNGRVAYIYLPDTAAEGARRFMREFYAQAEKQAAIIDERFNGGGEHATDIVEYLLRKPMNFTTTRSGADFPQPSAIPGPKVMIINEFSGSGGDLLPWYFRRAKAGKLVGTRTWGGVVGLWASVPALLDGGFVVVPSGLSWNPDGVWDLENVGVPPDFEVDQDPKLVREGKDPQLDKAIEVVLADLAKHPVPKPKRPVYPDQRRR